MESLSEVCKILRYNNHHELAGLLANSRADLELVDIGFPTQGDSEIAFVNAVIYAPISTVNKLRALNRDDHSAILGALGEVWPLGNSGGTYIQNVEYRIDMDSLNDDPLFLFDSPTGWERVDRTLDKLRTQLSSASTQEDFQQLGLLCREALISLAQAVFDPNLHLPLANDDLDISNTDVKRMMQRYLAVEYPGSSNEELRKCVRSAYALASAVVHDRDSTYRDAALCVQATFSLVGLIEVLSGKRDRVCEQEETAPTTDNPQHGVDELTK